MAALPPLNVVHVPLRLVKYRLMSCLGLHLSTWPLCFPGVWVMLTLCFYGC